MEKKKEKSIIWFFIKMIIIFILLNFIMQIVSFILTSSSLAAKYSIDLIMEIFYSFTILIVMLLFKNSYVFTEKKEKFWKSISYGIPALIVTIIILISNLNSLRDASVSNLINSIVLCTFIGIAEEFLCRGWLQNEFIERFSNTRASVIKSIILSSLIFGFMHITNISYQNFFETLLQILNAVGFGILLGSIYYKTKNIWSVIFIHGFYDFAIFLGEINLIKDCTYNTPTTGVMIVEVVTTLALSLIWILSGFRVLNSVKYGDISPKKYKRANVSIMMSMILCFMVILFPFKEIVEGYDDYEVCYSYTSVKPFINYEKHYPNYKTYYIEQPVYDDEDLNLEDNKYIISFTLNDDWTVSIKNNNTTYEVKLDIKDVDQIELLENENNYIFIIKTSENESTIYYNLIDKDIISNKKEFLNYISQTFKKYELPEIISIGYLTTDETTNKYPYFISTNNDAFIIENDKLYLVSEKN